ncbi:hypothetical protein BT69DRAFT_1064859 [Atractiella rhizophila]|nr:hypothetical protein BT69DRAFT_1064859 [Atractiella rhizophila]
MRDLRRDLLRGVEVKLLEQLRKLGNLMKAVDAKKKNFESESKGYYDHVAKYLSIRNDGDDSAKSKEFKADAKYKGKRDQFHVARIDYHNFLYDLAVFKEIELLSLLTRWSQYSQDALHRAAAELQSVSDKLNRLDGDVEAAREDVEIQRRGMEEERREAEMKLALNRPEQMGMGMALSRQSLDVGRDGEVERERGGLVGLRERMKKHLDLNGLSPFPMPKCGSFCSLADGVILIAASCSNAAICAIGGREERS